MKTLLWLMLLISPLICDTWEDGVPFNTPRAGASAVTYNGKIYLFGGKSVDNRVLNTVEVFDPGSNTWDSTVVSDFKEARYNAAAVLWQGKIYLTGGGGYNDKVLKSVEVYDPVHNSWDEVHEMRKERRGHSAIIFNNHIYCFGGQKNNSELVDEIEWFDTTKSDWEEAGFDLNNPRVAFFPAVYNNQIYMFGGSYFGPFATGYKTEWADSEYTWMGIDSLSQARSYGATARIDSLIYMIGGETQSGKTNLVEIYNANSNTIRHGEDMPDAQSGMTAAVLHGKIYVMGGYQLDENDVENDVHILTPTVLALPDPPKTYPQNILLAKAYPNPFNGFVRIDLNIPLSGYVQIDIFNTVGQKIVRLFDGNMRSGKHSFHWNAHAGTGANISSGMYLLTVQAGRLSKRVKLVYVK